MQLQRDSWPILGALLGSPRILHQVRRHCLSTASKSWIAAAMPTRTLGASSVGGLSREGSVLLLLFAQDEPEGIGRYLGAKSQLRSLWREGLQRISDAEPPLPQGQNCAKLVRSGLEIQPAVVYSAKVLLVINGLCQITKSSQAALIYDWPSRKHSSTQSV